MKKLFFCTVLMLATVLAHAELYRWVDAEGKVHYSDTPPAPNVKSFERRRAGGGKPGEAPLPYTLQQAVKNFPVTLYTTECGDACSRARKLLTKRGVPYTEMDANDEAARVELRKLIGPNLEVPVLKIGSKVVKGIEEGQWNTALDSAGYPTSAMIPPQPPRKKPPKSAPGPAAASEPTPAEEVSEEDSASQ